MPPALMSDKLLKEPMLNGFETMSWWNFPARDKRDAELAREIDAHLEHETELNVARGMSREDAHDAEEARIAGGEHHGGPGMGSQSIEARCQVSEHDPGVNRRAFRSSRIPSSHPAGTGPPGRDRWGRSATARPHPTR